MSDRIFTVILAGHDMSSNKGSKSAANAMKSCMRSKVSVAKIVDTAHLYESVWISLIFSQFQETEGILKDESLCMSSANHHQFVLWLVVKHHKVTLVSQGMRSKTWGHPPNGIDSNWLTKNAQFHIFSLMLLYLYLQEIQVGRFSRVHQPNKIGLDRVSSVPMLLVEVWHFSKGAAFILSRTVGLCTVHCILCIVNVYTCTTTASPSSLGQNETTFYTNPSHNLDRAEHLFRQIFPPKTSGIPSTNWLNYA